MKRAIIVGRWQPPHKGHLEVFKRILDEVDELIICIGSSQESHTLENPFTADERALMLRKAIEEAGLNKTRMHIVPVPDEQPLGSRDVHKGLIWVSRVVSLSPPFSTVYSGNPWVKSLFEKAGFKVKGLPMVKREEYWGTEIRDRIIKGGPWEDLVPRAVLKTMKEIKAVERLEELSKK